MTPTRLSMSKWTRLDPIRHELHRHHLMLQVQSVFSMGSLPVQVAIRPSIARRNGGVRIRHLRFPPGLPRFNGKSQVGKNLCFGLRSAAVLSIDAARRIAG